jgi:hypothetical protein
MEARPLFYGQERKRLPTVSVSSEETVGQLVGLVRGKAKALERSSGMRLGFQSFLSAHMLAPESIRYSDYVVVRLFEFLVERAGVKSVGLFWPAPKHTVAVWVVRPASGPLVRVVVPTSQILLDENDMFDTKKFNPWRQKTIYEYTRRDAPDSFEFPKPLFDFFLQQVDKYAGASDLTLQKLRYLREGVFSRAWTPEQAAREALSKRSALGPGPAEDLTAYQNFAADMRSWVPH